MSRVFWEWPKIRGKFILSPSYLWDKIQQRRILEGKTVVLSDGTLFKMLEEGTLLIILLDKEQVQLASIDTRLGDTFSTAEDLPTGIITLKDKVRCKTINTDTYTLLPGQFVLATTMEYVPLLDNLTVFVEGRSSLGCLGLFIQNAGWVDPGFRGEITLKLFNANRRTIEPKVGRRADQLVFAEMDDIATKPCNGKYQGQGGATGSRVYID